MIREETKIILEFII